MSELFVRTLIECNGRSLSLLIVVAGDVHEPSQLAGRGRGGGVASSQLVSAHYLCCNTFV